jgi:hypothetical protein
MKLWRSFRIRPIEPARIPPLRKAGTRRLLLDRRRGREGLFVFFGFGEQIAELIEPALP